MNRPVHSGYPLFPGKFIYHPPTAFMSDGPESNDDYENKWPSIPALLQKGYLRIVLADDDKDDWEMFAEAIEKTTFNVHLEYAENGSDLLNMLFANDKPLPHLIFLDLNMPNKNGKECLDIIRKNERLKSIPVIIYSTSSSLKDIDETFERGANLYIRKPSSFNELLLITRKVLSLNLDNYKPKTSRSHFVFSSKTN